MKRVHITPLTAISVGLGITALVTGILTLTGHNIALGVMFFAIGLAAQREDVEEEF